MNMSDKFDWEQYYEEVKLFNRSPRGKRQFRFALLTVLGVLLFVAASLVGRNLW